MNEDYSIRFGTTNMVTGEAKKGVMTKNGMKYVPYSWWDKVKLLFMPNPLNVWETKYDGVVPCQNFILGDAMGAVYIETHIQSGDKRAYILIRGTKKYIDVNAWENSQHVVII